MHTFVCVIEKPGQRIAPDVRHRLVDERPDLRFEPVSDHSWTDASGAISVRGWERPVPALGIRHHAHVDAAGALTTFAHEPFVRGRRDAGVEAAEVLAGMVARGPEALRDALTGVFAVAHCGVDGRGWMVGDGFGMAHLYVAETEDRWVCATSAAVAAWAVTAPGRRPERDPLGVAWLAHAGRMVGDRSGFAGVSVVPAGAHVELDPAHGMRVRTSARPPWVDDEGWGERDAAAAAAAVAGEIRDHLHRVAGLPAPHHVVGLTGGKDSRLILACLLAEGLADDVEYRTMGAEKLADVEVARELASAFDLPHSWGRRPGAAPPRPYEERVRSIVSRASGMVNIWDMKSGDPVTDVLDISGVFGEMLRTAYPGVGPRTSLARLESRFAGGWPFAGVGLLLPEVEARLHEEAHAWMFEDPSGELPATELVDRFYLRYWLRRWFGEGHQIDGSLRVFPLYSGAAIRVAQGIGPSRRRAEELHRTIIEGVSPKLASLAFAGSGWPKPPKEPPPDAAPRRRTTADGIRSAVPSVLPSAARSVGARLRRPAAGGNTAKQQQHDRILATTAPVLEEYLHADPANPAFDVLDRERLTAAVADLAQLGPEERKRVFGALTAVVWLGGLERG